MTEQQATAMRLIFSAVIESVKAAGSLGAPGGIIYAALMTQGCSLSQFQSLMSALVRSGKLTQEGDLYFAV